MNTKEEFLQRADEAFNEWVPAAFNLYYRQQIELNRTHYKQQARHANVDNFIYELMDMDIVFAKLAYKRMSGELDNAILCLLLVARYAFNRERIAARKWREPNIGGAGDQELNQACLFKLLDVKKQSFKCAVNGAFGIYDRNGRCGPFEYDGGKHHAAIT